jgi:hypothetical protein
LTTPQKVPAEDAGVFLVEDLCRRRSAFRLSCGELVLCRGFGAFGVGGLDMIWLGVDSPDAKVWSLR